MSSLTLAIVPMLILALAGCAPKTGELPPLRTVAHVELGRYLGEWYEIARYPNRFQEGCARSKATYTAKPNGRIGVLNECFSPGFGRLLRSARGTARVVDPRSNAKLKVTFFWPFSGDYWIIDLDEEYRYAVVGHPRRKYLWILSREKSLDEPTFRRILERLPEQGYDPDRLITSNQQEGGNETEPVLFRQ